MLRLAEVMASRLKALRFHSFIAAVRGRSLSLRSGGSGELSGPKQSLVFSQKPGGELFEPKMDTHVNFYVQIMY